METIKSGNPMEVHYHPMSGKTRAPPPSAFIGERETKSCIEYNSPTHRDDKQLAFKRDVWSK